MPYLPCTEPSREKFLEQIYTNPNEISLPNNLHLYSKTEPKTKDQQACEEKKAHKWETNKIILFLGNKGHSENKTIKKN